MNLFPDSRRVAWFQFRASSLRCCEQLRYGLGIFTLLLFYHGKCFTIDHKNSFTTKMPWAPSR